MVELQVGCRCGWPFYNLLLRYGKQGSLCRLLSLFQVWAPFYSFENALLFFRVLRGQKREPWETVSCCC